MSTRIILPDHFHAVSGYPVYVLDEEEHLQACANLDQEIHDALREELKWSFLPHDAEYYRKKVLTGNKIVGAFDGGKLIAKGNLTLDLKMADHVPMMERFLKPEGFSYYAMTSGDATHPDYRGMSLHLDLIKVRALLAHEAGKKYLMAVFEEHSDIGKRNYMRMGMSPLTDFEPSIFGGALIQFFRGDVQDALDYKRS